MFGASLFKAQHTTMLWGDKKKAVKSNPWVRSPGGARRHARVHPLVGLEEPADKSARTPGGSVCWSHVC